MPTQINGLPAHVLLVHVVVVLIPVASLAVIAAAWWPAARRRLGLATPVLAVLSLIVVPITTHAGQWLLDRLPPPQPLANKHATLGAGMLKYVIGLAILGVAVYVVGIISDRQAAVSADERVPVTTGGGATSPDAAPAPARRNGSVFIASIVVAVLATAISVGTIIMVYRVGDSGAHAVWNGVGTH